MPTQGPEGLSRDTEPMTICYTVMDAIAPTPRYSSNSPNAAEFKQNANPATPKSGGSLRQQPEAAATGRANQTRQECSPCLQRNWSWVPRRLLRFCQLPTRATEKKPLSAPERGALEILSLPTGSLGLRRPPGPGARDGSLLAGWIPRLG